MNKAKELTVIVFLVVVAIIIAPVPFFAAGEAVEVEEGDRPVGPHGGYFADAGSIYRFEVFLHRDGMLKVYLYDDEANPVRAGNISMRWTIAPDNPYPLKGNFQLSPSGEFYWIKFPAHQSEIVHLSVEAGKNGEWVGAEYFLPADSEI